MPDEAPVTKQFQTAPDSRRLFKSAHGTKEKIPLTLNLLAFSHPSEPRDRVSDSRGNPFLGRWVWRNAGTCRKQLFARG
jgi:hypothetical protein